MEQEKVAAVPTLDAILVMVVTFVLVLFLGSFFFIVLGSGPALVLSELLILIVPLGYMLAKHVDIKRYVGLDVNPKLIILGLASGALLLFVDIIVSAVLTSIFGVKQLKNQTL